MISKIFSRESMINKAWLAGWAVGPLFAWLCWAIQRRRIGHIVMASAANLALWIGGPIFIASAF